MPTTGVDFSNIVSVKIDQAFSSYFNPAKRNQIIKEATILQIDALYATNDKGRIRDELFSLYRSGITFTPTANAVSVTTGIPDYDHLLDVLCDMVEEISQLSGLAITAASNTTPIKLTFSKKLNIRTGDKLNITGVLGNTTANGVRYIKMVNGTQGFLYSNAAMTIGIIGNGAYISGGTIQRYVSNWAQQNLQKTAKLGEPSLYYPKYQISDGSLVIFPKNVTCANVAVDFISKPTNFIDVTNNSTDLELTYSLRLIDDIANKTCELCGFSSRDVSQVQNSQAQLIQQP